LATVKVGDVRDERAPNPFRCKLSKFAFAFLLTRDDNNNNS